MEISEFDKAFYNCFPSLNTGLYRHVFKFTNKNGKILLLDFIKKQVWIGNEVLSFSNIKGGEQYEMRVYGTDGSSRHANFICRDLIYVDTSGVNVRERIDIQEEQMDKLFWILLSTIR